MHLDKAKSEEKKGLFHSEGDSSFFAKLNKLKRGEYRKKKTRPEWWKRWLMGFVLFVANTAIKLFGKDIGGEVAKITPEEVLYQKEVEDKVIESELISAAQILQDQANRKKRGQLIKPRSKIIHRKKGIADYGKFLDKEGNELTPFLKP